MTFAGTCESGAKAIGGEVMVKSRQIARNIPKRHEKRGQAPPPRPGRKEKAPHRPAAPQPKDEKSKPREG